MRFWWMLSAWKLKKEDQEGNPIQHRTKRSGSDSVWGFPTRPWKFAFGRAQKIQEVQGRFQAYMKVISGKTKAKRIMLSRVGNSSKLGYQWQSTGGLSTTRCWWITTYGKSPREELICMTSHNMGNFICGSQVQLDVSIANYLSVINAFLRLRQPKLSYLPILSFQEQNGILRFLRYLLGGFHAWDLSRECRCQCQTLQRWGWFLWLSRPLCDFYSRTRWKPTIFLRFGLEIT